MSPLVATKKSPPLPCLMLSAPPACGQAKGANLSLISTKGTPNEVYEGCDGHSQCVCGTGELSRRGRSVRHDAQDGQAHRGAAAAWCGGPEGGPGAPATEHGRSAHADHGPGAGHGRADHGEALAAGGAGGGLHRLGTRLAPGGGRGESGVAAAAAHLSAVGARAGGASGDRLGHGAGAAPLLCSAALEPLPLCAHRCR